MPRTILGKVSLTPKGEYSPDTAYTTLDVVNYGGSSWMALKDVTGVAPAEGENWMLLAQKGNQGASFTRLEKTAGTGAPGTIDTYTAYNSEGEEAGNIKVYNGMDGTGAGDFKADGTVPMTGDLQMAQHKITGLADATEDGDAVNKGQMDTGLAERADLTLSNLSNRQKALRNIGGRPGRNLLDNWYFVGGGSQQGGGRFPINQRGQTSYPGPGYIIDRWKISDDGGTLTVNQNGITYQNTTENTSYLSEILELSRLIPGGQYTMSALFAGGSAKKAAEFVCYRPGSPGYSVFTGNAVEGAGLSSVTFTVPEDTTSLEARMIVGPYGTTGDFTAVAAKLELGDHQTLAYQDEDGAWQLFETPDYGEELAKCQRYLWKSISPNGFSILGYALANSQAGAYLLIELPVSLRDGITPSLSTINFSNLIFIGTNGLETLAHSWMIDGASAGDKVLIQCHGTFIAGQTFLVLLNNNDTLSVSAEL